MSTASAHIGRGIRGHEKAGKALLLDTQRHVHGRSALYADFTYQRNVEPLLLALAFCASIRSETIAEIHPRISILV